MTQSSLRKRQERKSRSSEFERILSFDPGELTSATACAVLHDGVFQRGYILMPTAKETDRRIDEIQRWAEDILKKEHCSVVAIEKPYLGFNPKTFMILTSISERIAGACVSKNLSYMMISPRQWQTGILGVKKMKRLEIKKLAREYAIGKYGEEEFEGRYSQDLIDAIIIGEYAFKILSE